MNEKLPELKERAKRSMPGGVNSPVRALKAVAAEPFFVKKAAGSKIYDSFGKEYLDYCMSFGPLLFGHAKREIVETIREVAPLGTSYGITCESEVELAEKVIAIYPAIERLRLVSSGTEAAMSAIRLARAASSRNYLLKFDGCYHGHSDSLLVQAGSGLATLNIPSSPGVPEDLTKYTLSLPYNDLARVEELLAKRGQEIATIIIEPVAGNMGLVPASKEFLTGLRQLCDKYEIVLIFDEVISGFRLAAGGASELYGVKPDLTILGKILGGGLPIGAYGGKHQLMSQIAPEGKVYQAGTLSGNPLAVAAGLTMLKLIAEHNPYDQLASQGKWLAQEINNSAQEVGLACCVNQLGSLLTLFFSEGPVTDFSAALKSDTTLFTKLFKALFKAGIYLPPANFECLFLSTEHTQKDLERTAEEIRKALTSL